MGDSRVRIGVSACLAGETVRYDGAHRRDAYLMDRLARYVDLVPVCPETGIGLGVPRETLHLIPLGAKVHMRTTESGRDHTDEMLAWSQAKVEQLIAGGLDGFLFKARSPSCGVEGVAYHTEDGAQVGSGRGLFAATLIDRVPHLPVEDERRIQDPHTRENFVERAFAYRRLRRCLEGRPGSPSLLHVHTAERLLLTAHDPLAYRRLGRLVCEAAKGSAAAVRRYEAELMAVLAQPSAIAQHVAVLEQMLAFVKALIGPDERQEMVSLIADFRRGVVPLVVPVTLLAHYARRHEVAALERQTYLAPYPTGLMLRDHLWGGRSRSETL